MPTLDYLKDKAAWSDFVTRNVDPNAPQNLATRARRQQAMADRDALAAAQVEADSEAMRSLIARDRKAQSLYFGQQRLEETRRMHDAQMRIAEAKRADEAEMFPLKRDALIAQTKAASSLERARTQAADFKARMDQQEHDDTAGFTSFIVNSGARRGTPEFANAVAEARVKFPAVPMALFDDTWKMTGSNRTPEEVQASLQAARAANPNATITATEKGTTITDRPGTVKNASTIKSQIAEVDKVLLPLAAEWRKAKNKMREGKPEDETAGPFEDKLNELTAQRAALLKQLEGEATPASRPALNDIFK